MSDVKNIYFVYSLFQIYNPQVITDARLEYIRLRVRIRDRSTGDWKCLSVNPAVDGCLFFSGLLGRMRQQRERNWLRISYALSKIHWASDPPTVPLPYPLQPLGYAGSLGLLPVPPAV